MTNTKFRKRALLSSVAMLLVALVALGSATFAWFVTKPDSNAEGFSMKTSTTASLLVQSESDALITNPKGFLHTTYLNSVAAGGSSGDAKSLQPASWTGTAFATVQAASETAAAGDGNMAPATSADVYQEKVYFKLATEGDDATVYLKKVNWTAGAGDMAPAVHVLIQKSDGTVVAHFGPSAAAQSYLTGTTGTYATASRAAYTDNYATQIAAKNTSVALACGTAKYNVKTTAAVANSAVTESDLDYVTVSIYLDGEYEKVYSNNVVGNNLANLMTSLNLDFSLNAD